MKSLCLASLILLSLALTVEAQSTGSATLAWNPVTDTNSVSAITYKFYQGTASGVYTTTNSVGTNLMFTANTLNRGVTYYFAVTAVGTYRVGTNTTTLESGFSSEVSYQVPFPPPPPTTLTIISGN